MAVEEISLKRELGRVQEILRSGVRIKLHIKGTSMLPLLDERTDAVLLAVPARVKPGDIALYRLDTGDVALHRIVGETSEGFVMQGDHLLDAEHGIRADSIIAVVERIFKKRAEFSVNHPIYRGYVLLIRRRFVRRVCRKWHAVLINRKARNG